MKNEKTVKTHAETEAFIERFNSFHDGFIKRLTLESHDSFEKAAGSGDGPDVSQILSGEFGVSIEIAHHNYSGGSAGQIVMLRFSGVADFELRTPKPSQWAIDEIRVISKTRKRFEFISDAEPYLAFSFRELIYNEL